MLGVFSKIQVVLDLFEVVTVDGADITDAVFFKEGGVVSAGNSLIVFTLIALSGYSLLFYDETKIIITANFVIISFVD